MPKNNMNIQITEDNCGAILAALKGVNKKILTMWGMKAETYAKKLCPVGTSSSTGKKGYRGGTLRNSITFSVDGYDHVKIGSNVYYAPFVELGTMDNFVPPEEWETFDAKRGSRRGNGIRPHHFLRDAIKNHIDEYKEIALKYLGS